MPKPSIPIELGGKSRRLRYTFNALCAVEDALGAPITEILDKQVSGSVSVRDLRGLIWAGLLDEDESIGIKEVGEWLDEEGSLQDVADKFRMAFEAAFPDKGKSEEKN